MTNPTPGIPDTISTIAKDVDQLGGDPAILAIEKGVFARIPTKIRGGIYETGRVLGLVGAGAFAVAGVLDAQPGLYVTAGAGLMLALSGAIAKANLS